MPSLNWDRLDSLCYGSGKRFDSRSRAEVADIALRTGRPIPEGMGLRTCI